MHRNVAKFTSYTLVIKHVILCYALLIPMSETILLSMPQAEVTHVLEHK